MNWMLMLEMVSTPLAVVYIVHTQAGMWLKLGAQHNREALNWIWWVTRWPAVVAHPAIYLYGTLNGDSGVLDRPWSRALMLVAGLGYWWAVRDAGDDDFRKRRREALRAKVQDVAGRLVVVPTPVPTR